MVSVDMIHLEIECLRNIAFSTILRRPAGEMSIEDCFALAPNH